MKTTIIDVTPEMARQWLESNTDNRPIRSGQVESLRAAFARGEYIGTHQGIAFDDDGVLLDGQHRLTAISLINDPGAVFPMMVTRGMTRQAFDVIDSGMVTRSVSDVLRVDPCAGTVGTFYATLMLSSQKSRPTAVQARPYVEFVQPEVERLMAFCPTAAKTWSAAAVKAAVVLTMKTGNADYALTVYRSMVLAKFDEMVPIVQALYRAHMAGSVRAAGGRDMFLRCLKVMNPKNARLSRVQISDPAGGMEEARALIATLMGATKKKAPAMMRGAKVSAPQVYRIG